MNNTPELNIASELPVLSFNFEQLKAWALGVVSRYEGAIVLDDTIADVKRDMAELNKAKKAVDDARKEAVRRISEPIRGFEAQIKEVCAIFDTAYAGLSSQVKAFEDAHREAKRKEVEALIVECNENAFGKEHFLVIGIQERWLNKATTIKSIREDIAAIIQRYMEDEEKKRALEQARQDRAAAIESHVKSLNEKHGLDLSIAKFMTSYFVDMTVPLEHAHRRINDVFENEVKCREAEKAAKEAKEAIAQAEHVHQAVLTAPKTVPCRSPMQDKVACDSKIFKNEQQTFAPETRSMNIMIEYDVAKAEEINRCLKSLRASCLNFNIKGI